MELNAEQIIKALECCYSNRACDGCPYSALVDCRRELERNTLSFIKELTEDVERVRKQCGEIIVECDERDAERLKQVAELTEENERLRERNIVLEQKFIILNREEIPVLKVQ